MTLPPAEVLDGIAPDKLVALGRGTWRAGDVIVKRMEHSIDDVAAIEWEHALLRALNARGFPAQVPLAIFVANDAIWCRFAYMTGEALGWSSTVPLEAVGSLVARFHEVTRTIECAPRPGYSPVDDLLRLALDDAWIGGDPAAHRIARRCADVLEVIDGSSGAERLIIHGDPHCDNVIADGDGLGLIDFGSAHHAEPEVDLAFGLWRTGRPDAEAVTLDPARVAAVVRGYSRPVDARRLVAWLAARGLMLCVLLRDSPHREYVWSRELERAEWIGDHSGELEAAVRRSAPGRGR